MRSTQLMCHMFFGAHVERRPDLTPEMRLVVIYTAAPMVYLDELGRRIERLRVQLRFGPDVIDLATRDFADRYLDLWFPAPGIPDVPREDRHRATKEAITAICRGIEGEEVRS